MRFYGVRESGPSPVTEGTMRIAPSRVAPVIAPTTRRTSRMGDDEEPVWEQDALLNDMLEWVTLTNALIPRLEEVDTLNSDSAGDWLRKAYDPDSDVWEPAENGSWAIAAFISERAQEIREERDDADVEHD